MTDLIALAATNLGLPVNFVRSTAALLAQGDTIPFISRYRKEVTGNMDEISIRNIQNEIARLAALEDRRAAVLESIEQQEKLTPELRQKIDEATTMSALEDLYLPFRPRRRTRATVARERGLEPLAKMLMSAREGSSIDAMAKRFVKDEVTDTDMAIEGASDIIAEWVSERPAIRNGLRRRFQQQASVTCTVVKGKEAEAATFRSYFDYSHSMRNLPSHQYLAMRRGEAEGLLKLSIKVDEEQAIDKAAERFIPANAKGEARQVLRNAVADGYKRLLRPSIETEMAAEWKEKADDVAIELFASNLRQLLLGSPLRGRRILALDPGFRTGCKVVALDESGNLLADSVIYPNEPKCDTVGAMRILMGLIDEYELDTIALGDKTASRETQSFLRQSGISDFTELFIVSENGASVYSASDVAREEFPDKDVTVRGAVSIGRRLIDPLAELVKIDPKSIGVGQYQHDVDQSRLKDALDFTVMSCVNSVGVDLNTASPQLLGYISGIGKAMAAKIVDYRSKNGRFATRADLLKVPRLGAKIFEQAAGFLRVPDSPNPLDNTGIHPESYHIVERMAADLGVPVASLPANESLISKINPENYAEFGAETVKDILTELRKPGRDPREEAENVQFDDSIHTIDDLSVGMVLPGKVSNITAFGAFIDLGIKENGLLHISQMSNKRISKPEQVVKLNQHITVKVIDVDFDRKRISLSLKDL